MIIVIGKQILVLPMKIEFLVQAGGVFPFPQLSHRVGGNRDHSFRFPQEGIIHSCLELVTALHN